MEKIGVGVIGAGDISILHVSALKNITGVELVGIYDNDPDRANQKSRQYDCQAFDSVQDLFSHPRVNAVFVLTPLDTHKEYAIKSLKSGKHTFIEKPVGVSVKEIEQIKSVAETTNLVCMPGHNYIYEPGILRAKDLISQGKLGQIVSVYVLYNIAHPEGVAARYPGVIRQILTHHSYIMLYLAGKPESLVAMKSVVHYQELTREDLSMVTLRLENGGLAHFCASFAADDHAGDPWTMMIKVIGTQGATRFSYRDWVENTPAEVHSQTYSAYPYGIRNIDEFFIDQCIRKGETPLSTLDDAITAQKIVEGIEASIKQKAEIEIA